MLAADRSGERTLAAITTLGLAAVVLLRAADYDGDGPSEVAYQVLLPLLLACATAYCWARARRKLGYAVPAAGFAACLPAVLLLWEDRSGTECSAWGFLPWRSEWVEPWVSLAVPLAAFLMLVLAALALRHARGPRTWALVAALACAATWFSAGVCVGS